MKKFLAGIAAAAIITVPMTSFALESMSKGALKKATGQAGVSIALDDVVIVQKSTPTTTYWDNDGVSSIGGTQGLVNKAGVQISYADNAQKMIILDGILNADKYGTDNLETTFKIASRSAFTGISQVGIVEASALDVAGDPGASGFDPTNGDNMDPDDDTVAASYQGITSYTTAGVPVIGTINVTGKSYRTGISPLSIDIGTCKALSAGLAYNRGATEVADHALDVAGVVIGLPTLEITTYHNHDVKAIKVVVGTADITDAANSGVTVPHVSNELISIEKSGVSQMAILGGTLEIAPH